jgi:hypothetical protein
MNYQKLRQHLRGIAADPEEATLVPRVLAFLKGTDWSTFDERARREADRILDGLVQAGAEEAKRQLPTLEDGAKRRQARRVVAYNDGEHTSAHDLVAVLGRETEQKADVVARAKEAFIPALQASLDFLYDARQRDDVEQEKTLTGQRFVVLYGLLFGLVDELLAAFHLAQRAFVNQAYSHIRTVEEFLDVAELLGTDEALLEAWLRPGDPKTEVRLYRQLSEKVRERFGRDNLYALLSAVGAHPQFRNLQARADILVDGSGEKTARFMFVGSTKQLDTANVLVARAATALAFKLARLFSERLNAEDVQAVLAPCIARLNSLTKDYLLPMAEQTRIDPEELRRILDARIAMPPGTPVTGAP